MQELIVYLGQLECYKNCAEILEKSNNVEIGDSQIQRIVYCYGQALEKTIETSRTLPPLKPKEVLYVEVDGSMIFTRDDKWKEVKVGRVFKDCDCIDPNGKSSCIRHSQYLAYLSNSHYFTSKMDDLIESYGDIDKRLVFISDGALWIRNWISDAFPQAVSILDYFHVLEHLFEFVNIHFQDPKQGAKWAEKQKKLLLESNVNQVINNIKKTGSKSRIAEKLITYYETNINRMDYKTYKKIGCGIIGSGAIESAHRTVIQKRMKQSGQRWSSKGAQNMLNLRVTYMNDNWNKVIQMFKPNFNNPKLKLAV